MEILLKLIAKPSAVYHAWEASEAVWQREPWLSLAAMLLLWSSFWVDTCEIITLVNVCWVILTIQLCASIEYTVVGACVCGHIGEGQMSCLNGGKSCTCTHTSLELRCGISGAGKVRCLAVGQCVWWRHTGLVCCWQSWRKSKCKSITLFDVVCVYLSLMHTFVLHPGVSCF